jgi:hypothetical protein
MLGRASSDCDDEEAWGIGVKEGKRTGSSLDSSGGTGGYSKQKATRRRAQNTQIRRIAHEAEPTKAFHVSISKPRTK